MLACTCTCYCGIVSIKKFLTGEWTALATWSSVWNKNVLFLQCHLGVHSSLSSVHYFELGRVWWIYMYSATSIIQTPLSTGWSLPYRISETVRVTEVPTFLTCLWYLCSRDGWYWNFSMSIIAWLKITIITITVRVYTCVLSPNEQWIKNAFVKFGWGFHTFILEYTRLLWFSITES